MLQKSTSAFICHVILIEGSLPEVHLLRRAQISSVTIEIVTLPEAYKDFADVFPLRIRLIYPCTKIMIMLSILLTENNLLMGQFTTYQKTSCQLFEHTLTRTWPMDLSDHLSPLPVPLSSLCLSLTEVYTYVLTIGVLTTLLLRISIPFPWLASLLIDLATPNNIPSWILEMPITRFVIKKATNGKLHSELGTPTMSTM